MQPVHKTKIIGAILWLAVFLAASENCRAAFSLTTNSDNYAVDTGGGLVFKVRLATINNQQKIGDIMSMVYNGNEYQDLTKGSQINSGIDFLAYSNNTVILNAQVVNTNYIVITCTAANLTHYYIARNGFPHIYMATWFNVEPVTGGGLCRYIVRANQTLLPNGPRPSDNTTTTYTVESGDIFGMPDGQTRSKHYSNHRLIDWFATGATGSGVGVFMLHDNQEGGSGGPFFRCLINQGSGDQEIYEIVNYGENQTESFRLNILNGLYTLAFNNGQVPAAPLDNSWLETAGLNLTGWVAATNRGVVTGTVSGVPYGFQTVVGFANTNAQYWAIATNGTYTAPRMIPGTYNVTLYKQEYSVATSTTTVSAGVTNTLNLTSAEANPAFVFKLGDWDGTPAGFLNADKMTTMHPSDVRMSSWATTSFTVENNPANQFPAIHARQINNLITVQFTLTAAQVAAHTVRVGMTTAYIGGRPNITVNSWTSALQGAPSEPNSRTFTTGCYRGNNALYSFSVPASAFVTGQNVLTIYPISGSTDLGGWLSAGWVYDCVQMDGTPIAPLPPPNVAASLNASQVNLTWTPVFNAVTYNLKRATTHGGAYTTIATNIPVAAFADTNAIAATRYLYVVSSVNSIGESTNNSAEIAAGVGPALMAYLPFDENSGTNANDVTGNGWNGKLINGASWNTGNYGSAANFNGTSNYVSLPIGVVRALGDFTIAAWVNQTSVNTWARVFDFGNNTTSYMYLAPRVTSGSGTIRFAITVAAGAGEQQINGPSALPTGWHHVAVTHSGPVGILFVDGVPVGTNSAMTLKPSDLSQPDGYNPTLQNYLGKSQFADPYLNGRVDDFRIYNGAMSAAQISALVATPFLAATNLIGTAISANQISLKWNAVAGATDYNVLRSTTSGGPYTNLVTSLTTTNYSDTGLNSSTTYYYTVAAVDTIGADISSASAAVTTLVAPAVPTGVTAIPVSGQINLSWNVSATATNYLVKRALVSGGPYTTIATNVSTSFADTNVNGGIIYYYVVAAFGPTGVSINSAEASALALTALQAYLKFDETTGTSAADSTGHGWTGTLVNGPTHVAGYSSNAVSLASASSQYATLPTGVVSNLNNFSITAWVRLTTASGWSRLFDFGTGQTVYMFLTPQNGANNVIRFAITTGGGAGEQQINGTNALPTGVWKHVAVTLSGSTGILYVDGVPVGTNSAMTLKPSSLGNTTTNYIGKSQYADPYLNGLVDEFRIYGGALSAGDVASLVTPLAAPTNFTATAGDGQVALSWNASANATSYQLLRSLTNGGAYSQIATLTTTNFTDPGLLDGTNYFYVVKAANSVSVSAASAQVSVRPVSLTAPQLNFIVGSSQLQFSWPADHTGWRLQSQTNTLTTGLGANWFDVAGANTTNAVTLPVNFNSGDAFFRLIYP